MVREVAEVGVHRGWTVRGSGQSAQVYAEEHSLRDEVVPLSLPCAYESRTLFQPLIILNHWFFCPLRKQVKSLRIFWYYPLMRKVWYLRFRRAKG